jgi:hypothetical protein
MIIHVSNISGGDSGSSLLLLWAEPACLLSGCCCEGAVASVLGLPSIHDTAMAAR